MFSDCDWEWLADDWKNSAWCDPTVSWAQWLLWHCDTASGLVDQTRHESVEYWLRWWIRASTNL
jgi:hypothetical protein